MYSYTCTSCGKHIKFTTTKPMQQAHVMSVLHQSKMPHKTHISRFKLDLNTTGSLRRLL